LLLLEVTLLIAGQRVLINQTLVQPGTSYVVPGYGDVGKSAQGSLVCRYFTGRNFTDNVLWYSDNNVTGRDECPTFSSPKNGQTDQVVDGGSLADWVSGIGSLLAAVIALGGYFWSGRERAKEEQARQQDAAYQIGYKIASLTSDAHTTHKALFPSPTDYDDWKDESDPFKILGQQEVTIGFDGKMSRDLTEAEQNVLMRLREESFLMNYTETYARNQSISAGLAEYKVKREAVMSMLPPPEIVDGQMASHFFDEKEKLRLYPYAISAATLMQNLRRLSHMNLLMLTKLCENFQPMMKKHYPKLHIHKIAAVSD
jgi:hypothetical protein